MVEIAFHPEAEGEYLAALASYRARSATAADALELEMSRILEILRGNPDRCPRYDDRCRFAMLKRFPFSVVYEVQQNRLEIIAVAHSSRSPGYWKNRA